MKKLTLKKWLILILVATSVVQSKAQDPTRFQKEVDVLVSKEHNFSGTRDLLLFTGSSSVRMWKDIQSAFPDYHVINNGFGGSLFSDLIHYYDVLIAPYQPDVLFIYEGDNDIATGMKPRKVQQQARLLLDMIRKDFPDIKIVLISPKPSIARWKLRKEYQQLNRLLEKLAKRTKGVEFADVWEASVDDKGNVYTDIFIDDNLHLNKKGYQIWKEVMERHLE